MPLWQKLMAAISLTLSLGTLAFCVVYNVHL